MLTIVIKVKLCVCVCALMPGHVGHNGEDFPNLFNLS